jgi:hypothetical protein
MSLLGNAAVLIWNDVVDTAERAFYEWHDKEHIPERLALPGFRRGRRYRGAGTPAWFTLYEADDMAALTSPAYVERLNHPTPATRRAVQTFRHTARSVCRVEKTFGQSSGGHLLTLRLPDEGAARARMEARLVEVLAATSVLAAHVFSADEDASRIDTAEARERAFTVPPRILVVETSTWAAAHAALSELLQAAHSQASGAMASTASEAGVFSLEISLLAGGPRSAGTSLPV